ncbi:HK97 family phage prohead protease [Vibrio parahaemolyticus]|nr:HK97 family phage prohead protease [Vibrio parahaemolyticus]
MELRASTIKSESGQLVGKAVAFGSQSHDLGGFVEIIEPTAFDNHLSTNPDVRALYEHDGKELLGRTTSGTLTINKRSDGIHVEIDPPSTQAGNDCKELVKRGDINGMSFGFIAIRDRWDWNAQPVPVRHVLEAELREVTVTATPAYEASSVVLRSLADHKREGTDLNELWLQYLEV